MIGYYLVLAARSFRKQPWMATLVAVVIGMGVGLFTTAFSIMALLALDPIPQKSDRLVNIRIGPVLDNGEPVDLVSSELARKVRNSLPELRVMTTTTGFGIVEDDDRARRSSESIRFSDGEFFEFFDAPLLSGRVWSQQEDEQGLAVGIIGSALANRLFRTTSVVGRSVSIGKAQFRVIGVLADWNPMPRYYDLGPGVYVPADQVYLPLSAVRLMDENLPITRMCTFMEIESSASALPDTNCAWLSMWVLMGSSDQRELLEERIATVYEEWLRQEGLSKDQGAAGVENVREMLKRKGVVPAGAVFGTLLASAFLFLCLVNAIGLFMAVSLGASKETGLRRALGASRLDIMMQFLIRSSLLGLAGAGVGILFSFLGIKVLQGLPQHYVNMVDFHWWTLVFVLAVSVACGIVAGLFPAWHASKVDPAIQVKEL